MSCKQTWKASTCLAIGAAAFALGVSTIPTLAGGDRERGGLHESMMRAGGGAGEMHMGFSGASSSMRVVNVSSANAAFSGMRAPSTEALRPSTEALKPSTEALHPSTEALKPSTEALGPSSSVQRFIPERQVPPTAATSPSITAVRPSTEAMQPSTEAVRHSTEAFRPSTQAMQPSTQAFQPSTEANRPSSSDHRFIPERPVRPLTPN